MRLEPAPFFADVAQAPEGTAWWTHAQDGVRLRVGVWSQGRHGTVLMLPGRTECIEKYGITAGELGARGFAMITLDWRGQGLADRLTSDPQLGHVQDFAEFQQDVAAMTAAARALGLPRPFYMLSHSMGGAIALRALLGGLRVRAAAFCAPMWGLRLNAAALPIAWAISGLARALGADRRYAPGTGPQCYLTTAGHAGNVLTTDAEMFAYMKRQVTAHPDLALGGPSLGWVHAALRETRALGRADLPGLPVFTVVGTLERVVDVPAITRQMGRWRGARLDVIEGAEHEVLMETPVIRARFMDALAAHFTAAGQ